MAKRIDPIRDAGLERELITPVGLAKYIYLDSPDYEFNKNGEYKVKLFFDPSDEGVEEMTCTLDAMLDEAFEYFVDQAKTARDKKAVRLSDNTPYYSEEDEEGELTGLIYMNPKSIASGTTSEGESWTRHIPVFDSQNVRVTEKLSAGGGTTMCASLIVRAYYNKQNGVGLSLRLRAVQIVNLIKFGGGLTSGEDAGFAPVEGGFQADTFSQPRDEDESADAGSSSEETEEGTPRGDF